MQNRIPEGQKAGGQFTFHPHADADTVLSAHDLSRLQVGPEAGWAAVTAAAGSHNMMLLGVDDSRSDINALVKAMAAVSSQPVVFAPHNTTPSQLLGKPGVPGLAEQADGGILVVENAPDWAPATLDALRGPVDTGVVSFSRGSAHYRVVTDFQLVLTGTTCPCGMEHEYCTCSPLVKRRYLSRIPGPLLDRVDIRMSVPESAGPTGIDSQAAGTKILAARNAAADRLDGTLWRTNAKVPGIFLRSPKRRLPAATTHVLDQALDRGGITLRGYDRILRVAWTIADMEDHVRPTEADVEKAVRMRVAPVLRQPLANGL